MLWNEIIKRWPYSTLTIKKARRYNDSERLEFNYYVQNDDDDFVSDDEYYYIDYNNRTDYRYMYWKSVDSRSIGEEVGYSEDSYTYEDKYYKIIVNVICVQMTNPYTTPKVKSARK